MKRIDIHTKKKINDDETRYSNTISAEEMKVFIFNQINFSLSEEQWALINVSFGDYWNNKVGIGGYFYWDEVSAYIYSKIIEDRQLISKNNIEIIVNLMLSKIEKDGGFME